MNDKGGKGEALSESSVVSFQCELMNGCRCVKETTWNVLKAGCENGVKCLRSKGRIP